MDIMETNKFFFMKIELEMNFTNFHRIYDINNFTNGIYHIQKLSILDTSSTTYE